MYEAELVKQTFKLLSNTFVIIDLIFWLVLGLYLLHPVRLFENKISVFPVFPVFQSVPRVSDSVHRISNFSNT